MLKQSIRKRKSVRKRVRMQEYELSYVLALPKTAALDDFLDKFVELVESMSGSIGGSVMPYVERKKMGKNW